MRKVGLKPGGGNKVAPFPTPSEKAGRAVEQLALSVLIGGISLSLGSMCTGCARMSFGQRDGFAVMCACAIFYDTTPFERTLSRPVLYMYNAVCT